MNKRLQQFLSAENLSQSQFADSIGVARASVSHILAGRNKPGFEFMESMARRFPALNLDWFITGKGRMYTSGYQPSLPEEAPDSPAEMVETPSEAPALLFPEEEPAAAQLPPATHKSIERITVFFSDGTFREFK